MSMRMRGRGFWLLWGLALVGMSGCSWMTPRQQLSVWRGSTIGALIGTGAGAAVGTNVGDQDVDDVAAGMGAGAVLGHGHHCV